MSRLHRQIAVRMVRMRVERTTVVRWEKAESSPQPAQRPGLAKALKISVEELHELLQAIDVLEDDGRPDVDRHFPDLTADSGRQLSNGRTNEPSLISPRLTSRGLLWQAAHASAGLSATIPARGLGPRALPEARDDLWRLTKDYVMTSDLPRIFGEALLLRDRLEVLIERRTTRLRDARELYVMMRATCLLLASI